MKNTNTFNLLINIILLIALVLIGFTHCQNQKKAINETKKLRQSIINSDKLIKEKNGQYAKLVNYYSTQRDLLNNLKEFNSALYKTIKKQDERLLNITSAVITLDKKVVQGFAKPDPIDTNNLILSLKYPNEKDPFVFWDGTINKNTAAYKGIFSFGKLPIKVVLTEESRGLWKSRIVGPEWLKVDSLSILSIPPDEYTPIKNKNIQFLVGGSYIYALNTNYHGLGVNIGLNLYDSHNLMIGANTLNQVSLGYLYKIKSFKRTN